MTRIDEGLEQQGLEAPVIEPVGACAARELSEHMAGQMRYPDVGKDQEAAVVHHPRQVLAAGLGGPADPAVAHGHRPGSAGQQDAAQAPVARQDEVAQAVAEGPLETQRVPARHQRIPLRPHGRVANHFQETGASADRAQCSRGSATGSTAAAGAVERRGGEGRSAGSASNPATRKRSRNSRQAWIFGVPDRVNQARCSQSVAANSWRGNPGSHATVAQRSAISAALNSRPQCTQPLVFMTSTTDPPAQAQTCCPSRILPETRAPV
ncbi:MAG: hypothetical protein IPK02_22430 [Candidatus Accumulibacter sp.]|uniref:Uncharacterized protein n=1 Tax=Candidatus Accumulibacter affinis TaxID=2954384 RepID=A0A935W5H4_9PROT|nr:hypothetical protein [Candidatus Accumulibacter affinis]